MKIIAFMRDLVAKGLSWEDAALFAEQFEQSVEEAVLAAVPKRSASARRQAAYRERKHNAERNDEHNAERNEDPRPLPLSPQTPQTPTPTPERVNSRATHEREEAAFCRFWGVYPRKVSKPEARKAFARAWRKLPPLEEEVILVGGLERAMASWTEPQFIPHPATWLNQERWTDEPTVIPLNPNRQAPHEPSRHDAKFNARQAILATHDRAADVAARFHDSG